jgi:hypothetical protein
MLHLTTYLPPPLAPPKMPTSDSVHPLVISRQRAISSQIPQCHDTAGKPDIARFVASPPPQNKCNHVCQQVESPATSHSNPAVSTNTAMFSEPHQQHPLPPFSTPQQPPQSADS